MTQTNRSHPAPFELGDDSIAALATAMGAEMGGVDREPVTVTYAAKNAFTGASVGDTITSVRVLNLTTATPTQEGATFWYNETTGLALASAPLAANLNAAGVPGLTDAQLRASPFDVGSPAAVITITPTIVTGAMSAGDVLFDFTELVNAVRDAGGEGQIQSITVQDKGDLEAAALDLYVASAAVSLGTSNAAPSISDANAVTVQHLGQIAAADWKDLGGIRVATLKGVNVMAAASATSLYIAGVTAGTANHGASDIVVIVSILKF